VAEWKIDYPSKLELEDGAELFIVDFEGEKLYAIYNKQQKRFVKL
jgi:hypothetical protein